MTLIKLMQSKQNHRCSAFSPTVIFQYQQKSLIYSRGEPRVAHAIPHQIGHFQHGVRANGTRLERKKEYVEE